jgi:multidrug resistance efflux pump
LKATDYKAQADQLKHLLETQKAENNAKIAELQQQLEQYKTGIASAESDEKMQFNYDKLVLDAAIKLTELEAKSKTEQNDNFNGNLGDVDANS